MSESFSTNPEHKEDIPEDDYLGPRLACTGCQQAKPLVFTEVGCFVCQECLDMLNAAGLDL